MSGLEGNPNTTSSGVAGSATSSSVEAGSDDPVDGSEPVVLQPSSRAETSISGGGNRRTTVTLEQLVSGKSKLTAWCWRFVSRFTPIINDKIVVCLARKLMGLPATTLQLSLIHI